MARKKTIAIIGATSTLGHFVAKGISNGPYRLLLMDTRLEPLTSMRNEIILLHNNAEVDVVQCCKDASWEADIIILAVDDPLETAEKIEAVATRKILINIVSGPLLDAELQALLPFSKVINVVINIEPTRQAAIKENTPALIEGYDDEAIKITIDLMKAVGLNPVATKLKADLRSA